MRRGPNLKLLPPVLRVADVVMMAILFSRGRPQPSVLGPRGRALLLRLETDMVTTLIYLSMSRWKFPFTVLSAHGVTLLW
jgi:Na+/H+ antiporter NhaB